MKKAVLKDIRVTINKQVEVGDTLYSLKPTISCVFEMERTVGDVRRGVVNIVEGTWIVDTDLARHCIENIANIDLETMVRNRMHVHTTKAVNAAIQTVFLKWCMLMTDDTNRRTFLSQYKGGMYEVCLKKTTNPYAGNKIPQVYRVGGVCKDDSFERAINESLHTTKFTLNRKRVG